MCNSCAKKMKEKPLSRRLFGVALDVLEELRLLHLDGGEDLGERLRVLLDLRLAAPRASDK